MSSLAMLYIGSIYVVALLGLPIDHVQSLESSAVVIIQLLFSCSDYLSDANTLPIISDQFLQYPRSL